MKNSLKKFGLIGLFFIGTFGMIFFINVVNGTTSSVKIDTSLNSGHVVRLNSLYLWERGDPTSVSMKIKTGENLLEVQGGFVIGDNHDVSPSNTDFSTIGGGKSNKIAGYHNGIVGGTNNSGAGKNSLIRGGENNIINAENTVIGGKINSGLSDNSVIIGGWNNNANGENSIVLGGQMNKAIGKNSWVMGTKAVGNTGSFSWSASSRENSARIDVNNGMLIGTYVPISGVKLVVSGAVSLSKSANKNLGIGGEIRVVNGCIYAYDGNNWQVVGRSSRISGNCGGTGGLCQFGETFLSQGDKVEAYSEYWAFSACSKFYVTCSGGNLVNIENKTGTYYPYCYEINN